MMVTPVLRAFIAIMALVAAPAAIAQSVTGGVVCDRMTFSSPAKKAAWQKTSATMMVEGASARRDWEFMFLGEAISKKDTVTRQSDGTVAPGEYVELAATGTFKGTVPTRVNLLNSASCAGLDRAPAPGTNVFVIAQSAPDAHYLNAWMIVDGGMRQAMIDAFSKAGTKPKTP